MATRRHIRPVEAPEHIDNARMTQRAENIAIRLADESAALSEFVNEVMRFAPAHVDKATEAVALERSCRLLAHRFRTWART